MSPEEQQSILNLDCEERYNYFLDRILDHREVWILVNENNQFLKIFAEEEGVEYLPIWPEAEFAEAYGAKESGRLSPKAISLADFLKKWISGLSRDGLQISVFPGTDDTIWIMEPAELQAEIKAELESSGF